MDAEKCICCNNTNNDETEGNLAAAKICKNCNNIYKLVKKIKNEKICNNLIYWHIDVNERSITFFFDGVITKEQYKDVKTLDKNTEIYFGDIAKYTPAECYLSEIIF